jgi:hypothetical protein
MTTMNDFGAAIAKDLHAYEEALDRAMALGAQLTQTLTLGRIETGLSAVAGQDALALVVGSVSKLGATRHKVVRAHGLLAEDAKRLRIEWARAGGFPDKPEENRPRPTGLLRQAA